MSQEASEQERACANSGVPKPNAGESRSLKEFFRKQSVGHVYDRAGKPAELISVGWWILTLFFLVAVVVAITFLTSTKYARKETIVGQVVPASGSFRITSQYNGIAEQIFVKDGQIIHAGEQIFSISSNPVLANGESLGESLKFIQSAQLRAQEQQTEARFRQIQSQIIELKTKQRGLAIDIAQLADTGKTLERRRELQLQNLNANKELERQGMVSMAAIRKQEDSLLEIEQQIQQVKRTAILQSNEYSQIAPRLEGLQAESDLVNFESISSKSQLHERQLNSDAQLSRKVLAPIDGTVTALQIHPGNTVSSGQTLAIVLPKSSSTGKTTLAVELWAPSKAIGFIKPGATVRLMYDAFPYENFGLGEGTVDEISGAPISSAEVPISIESREQLFKISVSLKRSTLFAYGKEWALLPGMRLSADVILEEQSLMDWLMLPVRAISKREK